MFNFFLDFIRDNYATIFIDAYFKYYFKKPYWKRANDILYFILERTPFTIQ